MISIRQFSTVEVEANSAEEALSRIESQLDPRVVVELGIIKEAEVENNDQLGMDKDESNDRADSTDA